MAKNIYEIHHRIYAFVLSVLNVIQFVPKTLENIELIRQLVRASASIGANAQEGDGAESKKDFIHKFTISKKEAQECQYWLSLLSDHNTKIKENFVPLLEENRQLIAIISTIVLNSKRNSRG